MNTPTLKNILYAEDEIDIQKIVKFSLEKIGGFNVKTCNSGFEALNALLDYKPDLILLDVMMPGMDGPTAFKEIRKNPDLSHIPVIFITAKVQASEVDNYKKSGAVYVIVKPFEPVSLPTLITDIWEKHHG